MEVTEKDVAVAPDLDNLLGLLSELFYPQYKGLKNKVYNETNIPVCLRFFYLNKRDKNPR